MAERISGVSASAAAASGAQSKMIPRLVLAPTAAKVASTDAQNAGTDAGDLQPTTKAGGGVGAGNEFVCGHPMAGGKDMNIAGLGSFELGEARPYERAAATRDVTPLLPAARVQREPP